MSFFSKLWGYIRALFTGPAVEAAGAALLNAAIAEAGSIAVNMLLAKAGQLKDQPAYIGSDGNVKWNDVRDEVTRFAVAQGITLSQQAIGAIVASAQGK